jgi:hypothetical protein
VAAVLVLAFTVPKVYELRKTEIDEALAPLASKGKVLYARFDEAVLKSEWQCLVCWLCCAWTANVSLAGRPHVQLRQQVLVIVNRMWHDVLRTQKSPWASPQTRPCEPATCRMAVHR